MTPLPTPAGNGRPRDHDDLTLEWHTVDDGRPGDPLDVELSWFGGIDSGRGPPGSEAAVQAASGLMQVHGQDTGRPRRLGLEVASVAAGILAASAVLAAHLGRRRGRGVARVESSVLDAALLLVSHRVAAATSGQQWIPAPPGPAPGPPFRSADGVWFEIETLDPEAWKAFWTRLGAETTTLGWAWRLFRSRFFRGTSTLPPGFHEAMASHRLADIASVAGTCAVSLAPVREYREVLDDLGRWSGHPVLMPLAEGAEGVSPDWPLDGVHRHHPGDLPLAGLRVVEATSRLQGPLAGLLLQWLGADVVRVEPPGGDPARGVAPLVDDTGTFFLCFNRGKEPVELDLGHAGGRAGLVELVAGADAFVQNWRPGKATEWKLEAVDLAAVNPRLVYASASGWGDAWSAGPLVGTDYLVQAHAGVAAGVTPEGQPPMPSRALLTDYFGALVTAEGILSGLYRRERAGRGCRVETSLLAGAMSLQAHVVEALAAGREEGRREGRPRWGRLDHPLDAADRLVAVTVDDDAAFRRLCLICGVDPDEGRAEDVVAERLVARPAAEWERLLAPAGIPCATVCTDLAALPADPRLSARFETLAGPCRAPTAPWCLVPRVPETGVGDVRAAGAHRP